jgi:hypothetical protein
MMNLLSSKSKNNNKCRFKKNNINLKENKTVRKIKLTHKYLRLFPKEIITQ